MGDQPQHHPPHHHWCCCSHCHQHHCLCLHHHQGRPQQSTLHSPTYSSQIPVCLARFSGISGIRWTFFLVILSLYGVIPAGLIYQIWTQNTWNPTRQIINWTNWTNQTACALPDKSLTYNKNRTPTLRYKVPMQHSTLNHWVTKPFL